MGKYGTTSLTRCKALPSVVLMACAKKRMTMQSCMVSGDETYSGLEKVVERKKYENLGELLASVF